MTPLGKTDGAPVARVEVGCGVVWREQHEEVQEFEDRVLRVTGKPGEQITSVLGFTPMAENDLPEVDAAAVVTVRCRGAYAPQRRSHELGLQCAVEVALVEFRAEVVAL